MPRRDARRIALYDRMEGAPITWRATRSPSSAPAMSARRPPSASPRPASPTSSWSTSSRGCRRARASTSPRPPRSSATTPGSPGTNDYADTAGIDIVVVTSGLARQPGMSRDDLLAKNAGIVRAVVEQAARHSPDAILIVVTNPLDAMCHVALAASGFPRERVLGHGRRPRLGPLPHVHRRGARRERRATRTRSSSAATATRWSRCRATRRSPACRSPSSCRADRVKALEERTANGGAEVVALLKTGSAFYAPAASTFEMVESILLDRKRVLPCAVLLTGRVRRRRPVRRRAGRARRGRDGARLRDRADARGADRLRRVGRGRPRARREAAVGGGGLSRRCRSRSRCRTAWPCRRARRDSRASGRPPGRSRGTRAPRTACT